MQGLIIHCILLVSIWGICLVLPISLNCKFFEDGDGALQARAASTLPSTVLLYSLFHILLCILSHPIVSVITSVWANIQTCCSALTSGSLLPSFSLHYVPTTLVFFSIL